MSAALAAMVITAAAAAARAAPAAASMPAARRFTAGQAAHRPLPARSLAVAAAALVKPTPELEVTGDASSPFGRRLTHERKPEVGPR